MSVTLEGIDLGDLIISNEMNRLFVETKTSRTLGGTELSWSQNTNYNKLDLVGGSNFGWITRGTMLQLKTMASIPNSNYILNYEGTEMLVRFRTEDNPVSASPIIPRPNQEEMDYYNNVVLKFMEVK